MLLTAGAEVNELNQAHETALVLANSNLKNPQNLATADITSKLLAARANPDVTDGRQRSALHYATIANNARAVQLLVDAGANANLKDLEGQVSTISFNKRSIYLREEKLE